MTGDLADFLTRLKMVLPARWFADVTPVLDALLSGFAAAWSGLFAVLTYTSAQTRVASATDIFLDLASADYLGATLPRRAGEADARFRVRIKESLLAPRATRASVVQVLANLTGREPVIFEPRNASDTGGYDSSTLGYNTCGGYGCLSLPLQFFVTAYLPLATAASNAGGYGEGPGGYDTAPMLYGDVANFAGIVTDADIYAAVAGVLPVCAVAWTNISN